MNTRSALLWQLAIFALVMVYTLVVFTRLPETVPVHWGINGKPDRFGSRWEALWAGPVLTTLGIVLTLALPRISPKDFSIDRFGGTFNYTMVLMSTLFAAIHVIIASSASGASFDIGRMLMAALFAFFALLGNVIGKVKRNFYMGVRTPWTLSSERVWDETHRQAARLWFAGGIVGALAMLLGLHPIAGIVLLFVISFWPVYTSYALSRRYGAM